LFDILNHLLRDCEPAVGRPFAMGWSKSTRIIVMIALDAVFLVAELTAGYWVGSLALIADAFHMVIASSIASILAAILR